MNGQRVQNWQRKEIEKKYRKDRVDKGHDGEAWGYYYTTNTLLQPHLELVTLERGQEQQQQNYQDLVISFYIKLYFSRTMSHNILHLSPANQFSPRC